MRDIKKIKKKITIGIIVLFIGATIMPNIIHTSANELKMKENTEIIVFFQEFSTPSIEHDGDQIIVNVKESNSFTTDQGGPKLPVYSKTFELPWGAEIGDIKFKISEEKTMSLIDKIEPVPFFKNLKYGQVTQQKKISLEIYENINYYPSEWFTYKKGTGINKNGDHVLFLSISVYPIRYLSKENLIKYITSFEIEVLYEKSEITNFKTYLYDLVIIAPSEFSDTLQPLVNHKNTYNVKTILMPLEDIYDSYNGRDEAEKIKYFIKYALEEWGINYVLFVGDITILPIRITQSMMFSGHGNDLLSDLYFADIYDNSYNFCSWDKNENNSFGEVIYNWHSWPPEIIDIDGVDLYPDVHIGRLPCSNNQEVALMVDKIIYYEKETYNQDWFKKIILAGGDTFPPRRLSDFFKFEGEITNKKVAEQLPEFEHIKLWATKRNLNALTFNRAINKGAGFLTYAGHGYEVGWATYKPNSILHRKIVYFTPFLYFLKNGYKMPIVFLDACLTSKLDFTIDDLEMYYPNFVKLIQILTGNSYKPNDYIPTFSWAMMNIKNGGAIATIGATRTAYTGVSRNDVFAGAGYLDVAFFKAYYDGTTVGEMLTGAQNDYINYVGKDYFTIEEFVLFGDPSLRVGGYQ